MTRRTLAAAAPADPAAVLATAGRQLPFTGFPVGRALLLSLLLTVVGVVLAVVPRRRSGRHGAH